MAELAGSFVLPKELTQNVDILNNKDLDPSAIVFEPIPSVVCNGNGVSCISNGDDSVVKKLKTTENGEREIVLGRNVHSSCLDITEPEDNDDVTGDKEAYMASVLARYRQSLIERTKYHLGNCSFLFFFV